MPRMVSSGFSFWTRVAGLALSTVLGNAAIAARLAGNMPTRRDTTDNELAYGFSAAVFFPLRPVRNHVNAPMTGNASTINAQTVWLPVV